LKPFPVYLAQVQRHCSSSWGSACVLFDLPPSSCVDNNERVSVDKNSEATSRGSVLFKSQHII
jgi:hypothetical protein